MPYHEHTSSAEMNLRVSPWHIISTLLIAGLIVVSVSDRMSNEATRLSVLALAMLCYLTAVLGWIFEAQQRDMGRWLLSIGISIVIHLGLFWLHVPGLSALITVPLLVAINLLNMRAGLVIALFRALCCW